MKTKILAAFLFACLWTPNLFGQAINIVNTSPLQDGVVGLPYSVTFTATGGTLGIRSWSVISGSLPAGLSLNSASGVLSGTPSTAGTSTFRIRVTSVTATDEKNFNLTINIPLSVSTVSLPNGTQGVSYSQSFTATGGETPFSWSLASGTLPAGLSLSAGGSLTGTPSAAGISNFTVRVTDSASPAQTATKSIALVINPPLTITTTSPLSSAITGTAYSQNLAATGATPPYTWALASGTLPTGLSLSSAGVISGTPTATGSSSFTVRATDSSTPAVNVMKAFSLDVVAPLTITTTSPLNSGMIGVSYSQTLAASGGTAPYTWSINTGSLPAGLTLSGATISGSPTAVGTASFTVRVTDSGSRTFDKAFTLDIVISLMIATASPLPSGVPGTPYSTSFSAAGGAAPYSWSVISGALPTGLSLSGAGVLSGTPSTAGTSTFQVRVLDSSTPPQNFQKTFTLSIIGALNITTSSPLSPGSIGVAYSQTLAATGGTAPFSWSIASGTLPAGLTLSGATISGTPTAAGTASFTIRVTDSGSPAQTFSKAFTIVVGVPLTITTTSPLPDTAFGFAYSQTFAASGGTAPFMWSISGGSLPTGLSLSSAGALTGTPVQAGSFSFTVSVADSSSPVRNASGTFALLVKPLLTITTSFTPNAAVGSAYSVQLNASGDQPLTWSRVSGTLPPGIGLSTSGLLSGSPSATGTYDFTIKVNSDSPPQESTRTFEIVVNSAVTLSTTTVPAATRFVPYTTTLSAAGGVPPYAWSISSGTLPTGLTLSAAGVLSGTPSDLGTFNVTVKVADSTGGSATRAFSIVVAAGALHITTDTLPAGVQGSTFSFPFTASGGPTPYTWALTSGTLPPGFALTTAGVLQGNPSSTFSGPIRVRVTDSAGASDQHDYTLVIGPPLGTVTLAGLSLKTAPTQQVPLTLSIPAAYPGDLQGTLTLTFTSTAVVPIDDPAVQFSTGGRSAKFTIPANTTTAVFTSPLLLVTGTVAGNVAITGSIQNGPPSLSLTSTSVDSIAPQMTALSAIRITGGLRVRVTGFSPERRVTDVGFSFDVRVNGAIQKVDLSRTVTTDFNTWYQNAASSPFGSAFQFEQLFGVAGDTTSIEAVTITLKNAQGSTTSARVPFTAN